MSTSSAMVDAGFDERSIVVSGLPEDASENEVVIHFQRRKNGGGDVDKIIWKEKRDTVLVVFADLEDAKSVLKTKQHFRDNLQLVMSPVPVKENEMNEDNDVAFEGMRIFESVSGVLDPSLFEGLTQSEVTSIMEKVHQSTLVQWIPSAGGLLSTGTIKQLEIVRDILGREVKLVRMRQKDQFAIKYPPSGSESAGDETSAQASRSKINQQKEIENDHEPPSKHVVKKFYVNRDVSEKTAQSSRQMLHDSSGKILEKSPARPFSSSRVPVTSGETGQKSVAAFESLTGPPQHARKGHQKSRGVKSAHENRRATKTTKISGDEFQFVANLPNMVTVQVLEGDLTNHLPADVIVNPCSQHLQNTCGIGASIIDQGGLSIQNELNDILGDRDRYPPGHIIQTRAGSLPYKNIFHAVCPQWDYVLKDKCSKVLHTVCLKTLNEFSATQMKTIAFPSFSCSGSFPLAEDTCAQVMLNAVAVFADKRELHSSKPINVHLVVDNDETLTVFQSELKKLLNAEKNQKTLFYEGTSVESEKKNFDTGKNKYAESSSSATKHSDESEEMRKKCPVCLENIQRPKTLEKCQHTFCTTCVESAFQVKKICPLCKIPYGIITGNQPDGKMSFRKESFSLPGFTECGTIVITYHFKGGIQGACHPNPGQRYSGTSRDAYLPDNREGNEVLAMLRKAFDHRLIFKIGTSLSSRATNQITWSDISQKSSVNGGERNFGYPDAGYLMRVKEQLAEKGIYP